MFGMGIGSFRGSVHIQHKQVRKNREELVSDKCWWCGQYRMSRTHVFLRCMHPKLEGARKDFWDRPDEDGKIRKRPTL
jgi:hypothetical protein